MSHPVLVRAYAPPSQNSGGSGSKPGVIGQALPPVSSFAFTDILRAADCAELQRAIDGIAHIYAHNRLSLADEYAYHLPPLGEITADASINVRPHLLRPGGVRPALTSVPEGSSGGSHHSQISVGSGDKRKNQRKNAAQKLLALAWHAARAQESKPKGEDKVATTVPEAPNDPVLAPVRAQVRHWGCTVPAITTTALIIESDACSTHVAHPNQMHSPTKDSARLRLRQLLKTNRGRGEGG